MRNDTLVPVKEFCVYHSIEFSLIHSLRESGLIEITTIDDAYYIPTSRLAELERIVCLYSDLDINMEGIETITHLLKRMNEMQNEIISLRNRLRLYETDD
jgi:chaperone modulatory protein CbpM